MEVERHKVKGRKEDGGRDGWTEGHRKLLWVRGRREKMDQGTIFAVPLQNVTAQNVLCAGFD